MNKSLSNDLKVFAKHLNVLIVEDEIDLGNELKSLLTLFFNEVYYAKDGEEGLAAFKKYRCDIVITDLNMPKMNGVELAKELRLLNKEQVIMVLSGYIDTFVIDLIDIGIQSLMLKPYSIENFMQKLLVLCENIVLKKEFEKMRLNKTLKSYSTEEVTQKVVTNKPKEVKKEAPNQEVTSKQSNLDIIVDEISVTKNAEESLHDYITNFNIESEIDTNRWKHISSEILELNEHYEELINKIILHGFTNEIKNDLTSVFSQYNHSLLLLTGLEKFADIFLDLSTTLNSLDIESVDSNAFDIFDMFEYFYDDIIKFFNIVFINKETNNLNYLTDSLSSSVQQLKLRLGLADFEEEELELF